MILASMPVSIVAASSKGLPRRSSFYDWAAFVESELGTPGVALLDEERCTVSQQTQPSIFAGNMLLNCDTLGIRNETPIAVNPTNPNNVIAGSHRYRLDIQGGTLIVHVVSAAYVTFDGGNTWTNVIPPLGSYQFFGDPAIAFDSRGNAYYAFIADHEGQGGLFTNVSIVVYRSTDGGMTWQGPVTVAAGNGGVVGPQDFNDKVYITADKSPTSPFRDRVYVTWTRFLSGPTGAYIESPIYESHSPDGVNWTMGREISGANTAICTVDFGDQDNMCDVDQLSQPNVGPDGTVYVAFENFNTPADNQMLIVRSKDGGNNWEGPFFATMVADGPGRYPSNADGRDTLTGCQFRVNSAGTLAVDPASGALYLVWSDNRKGTPEQTNNDVYMVRSTDRGRTWTTSVSVNKNPSDQFYPWAAVGPKGEVVVGYMDRQYQPAGAKCQYGFTVSVSRNSGKTFASQRVDTGISLADKSRWFSGATGGNTLFIGDYNGLAVGSDGNAWAVWTDSRQTITVFGRTGADQDAVVAKISLKGR